MITPVTTDKAPKAIGPYSQAARAENFLFISGQISIDPSTNELQLFSGNATEQAKLVLKNLGAIFASEKLTPNHVVKTTIFLKSMNDFAAINDVYANFFGTHKPARATVEVARLPKDVAVEIEAIACYT